MSSFVRMPVRKPMSLLVSLLMVTQVMFPAHLAASTPEIYADQANEFAGLLKNSEQLPAGQPRGSYAPDRFLLLDQEVFSTTYVGRSFSLFKDAREREIEKHESRMDGVRHVVSQITLLGAADVQNACAKFAKDKDLQPDVIRKELIEHLNEGRRRDIPFFVYNEKADVSRLACVREQVQNVLSAWEQKVQDQKQVTDVDMLVPNITEAPTKTREPYINWWEVEVDLVRGEDTIDVIKMSRSADYNDINHSAVAECTGDCEFNLKARGLRIHGFHIPVTSIATFGPFVVFTHRDSFDPETGIQYLSFLDLASYGASLGTSEIPVFRLPLGTGEAANGLKVVSRNLELNGKYKIPLEAFAAASEVQRAAFNITSNLVDPAQLAELMPYIQGLERYTEKVVSAEFEGRRSEAADAKRANVLFKQLGSDIAQQLEQNKTLKAFAAGKKVDLKPEDTAQLTAEMKALLDTYSSGLKQSELLSERMSAVSKRVNQERGFKARLGAFFNKLTTPAPNASLKIKRALVLVGAQKSVDRASFINHLTDRPWLASTVAAAAVIGAVSPETFGYVAEAGLAIGNGIVDYLKFATLNIWEAMKVGTVATWEPVYSLFGSNGALMEQYVNNGNWEKTAIGIGVFMPFIMSIYYIPHLVFNVHQVAMDYKEQKRKGEWKGFVHHQREFVKDYYKRLAEDEGQRRKDRIAAQEKIHFSAEEESAIKEFIERREWEQKPPGFLSRFASGTKKGFLKLAEAVRLYNPTEKPIDRERVKGVWSAIATLTFSYPAMELTLSRWARFWNWFAGTRYTSVGFMTLRDLGMKSGFPIFIRPKPISAGVRIFMPDFFNTVVAKQDKKMTIPTVLNGGLRGWEKRDITWYKEKIFGRAPINAGPNANTNELRQVRMDLTSNMQMDSEVRAMLEDQARLLNASELKAVAENFEAAILPAEEAAFKVGFNGAIERMADFLTDKRELVGVFTKDPLKSVAEKRVRDMPVKVRTFMRLFMDRVYEQTMKDYLGEVLAKESRQPVASVESGSLKGLKTNILSLNRDIRFANHLQEPYKFDAARVTAIAEKYAKSQEFFESVATQARRGELSFENWTKNRKYNLMADMDPSQNGSMKRYASVQGRLKSPNALSRAVRAEISKLLVTFPIDLLTHMFFSAAIYHGAFKPIQDSMWGENSIFYLSQSSFYMGMGAGFTISMMADAWMKLQQDARQDEMKGFDNIPKGQDADGSFFRWYAKQFSHKDNSLGGNWYYLNSLSFWNMPAALANMGVFYYAFSGRLDLSLLVGGYPLVFGTPIGAFTMKIEQAFERASEYAARGIEDEKWMAHPDIQALISKEKQAYRNKFQLWNDVFLNIKGNWLGNITIIPTDIGPRGFVRSMLGGYLIEELIVNKVLHPVNNLTANVPVVNKAVGALTGACEHLLTNGNTDLVKLKK